MELLIAPGPVIAGLWDTPRSVRCGIYAAETVLAKLEAALVTFDERPEAWIVRDSQMLAIWAETHTPECRAQLVTQIARVRAILETKRARLVEMEEDWKLCRDNGGPVAADGVCRVCQAPQDEECRGIG